MVPFSGEIRSKEAHLPATRKVKKSTPLPVSREVCQNSDFFLYEVWLYFNRLV